jgi:mono/diheme cytochrome c family protein
MLRPRFAAAVVSIVALAVMSRGTAAAAATVADASREAGPLLAAQVEEIFTARCASCHSRDSDDASAKRKLEDATDLARMAGNKKLVDPAVPEKSKLYKVIRDGDMPEGGEPLTPAQIATVLKWIEAGAPAPAGQATGARPFVSDDAAYRAILDDLLKLRTRQQPYARYFTLANLYNAGDSDEQIDLYRQALSKLANSLSWEREIARPVAVDPQKTVYRIDLRDLGWTRDTWDRITSAYPYAINYSTGPARRVYTLTNSAQPVLRADWFVYTASQPPLYHDVLGIPETDRKLEYDLHLDVMRNIRDGAVVRAGFLVSGVSQNNRLVERHRSRYGAYWKSYDFSSNQGRQNLFDHPLGPPELNGPFAFEQAGGEIIFNLPNGMQAYMLVDDKGNRIDVAPSTVVHDPSNRRGGAIVNGVSCMGCHAEGMRPARDEVRAGQDAARSRLTREELEFLEEIYPPQEKVDELLKQDERQFKAALQAAGATSTRPEPVRLLFDRFDRPVLARDAAAEVGLSADEFQSRLSAAPELRGIAGRFEAPGVARDQFIALFDQIVVGLRLGGRGDLTAFPLAATTLTSDGLSSADVKEIQDLLADVTAAAMSADGLGTVVDRLSERDRARLAAAAELGARGGELRLCVNQAQAAWQRGYGRPFDLTARPDKPEVLNFVRLRAEGTQGAGRVGHATLTVSAGRGLPEFSLPLVKEPFGWKIDVPDELTPQALADTLAGRLESAVSIATPLPSSETEGYRLMAHNVLTALALQRALPE